MQKFTDKNIILIEDIHEYRLLDNPDAEFTSATTFVKLFFRPFDKIGIANNLTSTHNKYMHLSPEELVREWDKIAEEGTAIHNEIENYINDKTEPTKIKSKHAVQWLKSYASDRYEFLSEIIIYSEELEIAGSIDVLIHDKKNGTYKMLDWKTNKKIDTKSYNQKMGTHPATANLMDCNFTHYSLQLSLYRYILEEYYGMKIEGTAIAHLTEHKITLLKTEYLKTELEKMLKVDVKELKQQYEDSLTQEFI